jgi:polysaccharide biosynthesis/export protein
MNMKKVFRIVIPFFLLLGCCSYAVAQNVAKQGNKLTSDKVVAGSPLASSNTQVEVDPTKEEFVLGTGDILAVNVWKEPEVSRVVPVRSDGRISLPLVGEIQAGGRTPKQLESEITARLKDFVSEPEVTVIVQEIRSQRFNVLGMIMRPGSYTLTKPMTVLDAIALAGGFRDFAKQKDIYVLRRNPGGKQSRLPFNYKDVVKGRNSEQNTALESGDTVVVP